MTSYTPKFNLGLFKSPTQTTSQSISDIWLVNTTNDQNAFDLSVQYIFSCSISGHRILLSLPKDSCWLAVLRVFVQSCFIVSDNGKETDYTFIVSLKIHTFHTLSKYYSLYIGYSSTTSHAFPAQNQNYIYINFRIK